jgi:hypothetical protein
MLEANADIIVASDTIHKVVVYGGTVSDELQGASCDTRTFLAGPHWRGSSLTGTCSMSIVLTTAVDDSTSASRWRGVWDMDIEGVMETVGLVMSRKLRCSGRLQSMVQDALLLYSQRGQTYKVISNIATLSMCTPRCVKAIQAWLATAIADCSDRILGGSAPVRRMLPYSNIDSHSPCTICPSFEISQR